MQRFQREQQKKISQNVDPVFIFDNIYAETAVNYASSYAVQIH